MGVSGIAFSLIAGVLVTLGIKYVWLVNFIMIIPFVFGLIMPEPEAAAEAAGRQSKSKEKIPGKTWLFIIGYTVMILFIYPYFLNMSSIVIDVGGSPFDSGLMSSLCTVGAIIAGVIFGFLFKVFPNRIICVAACLFCPAMFLFVFVKNILMLNVLTLIIGVGWVIMLSYMFTDIAISAPQGKTATVMGLTVAGCGLGQFVATYCSTAIAMFFGQSGNIRFPIMVCAIVFAALAVFLLFKPVKLI
ncbi:MAG: MFS transporter [Desulfitobacterium hafniense]